MSLQCTVVVHKRASVFPNGSLNLCLVQWRDEGEYMAEGCDKDRLHLRETFNLELSSKSECPMLF